MPISGRAVAPADRFERALLPFSALLLAAMALAALLCTSPASAASGRYSQWETIRSERYGFTIAYPSEHLFPVRTPSGQDGRVMQSADGKAKLLIATFENTENVTLDGYRDFLLTDIYANARIDYAPQRARWFVLSGERGGETFYERVTFSCGGKLINSWAMLYPTAEHKLYTPMLEAIAKTYSPGTGADGQCNVGGNTAEQTAEPQQDH